MFLKENDIIRVAAEVDQILTNYLKIHDNIFKASIRKIIPIPGIFKKIDYKDHNRFLNDLLTKLNKANLGLENIKILVLEKPEELTFINIFIEYVTALSNSMGKLRDICNKFQEKIDGERDYSMSEYNRDVSIYEESSEIYFNVGKQLNKYFNK
jgi:hypothetical protein